MKNKMETQEKKRTPMKYMITGILCFLMAILFFVGEIYIWNSCSVLVRISGFAMIIMLMFCGVIMIYGTNYIKKTEAEQYMIDKDIRSILRNKYCKKQKELQRKNKDMYRTIYRYIITKFNFIFFIITH